MKHLEALFEDGGSISIGPVDTFDCVATAADDHNCLAMIVRRDGETLSALLRRLDRAVGQASDGGECVDEVNG